MKQWAWLVAALYAALLLLLTIPAILIAFAPKTSLAEAVSTFAVWPYWLWLVIMFFSQLALLAVPVRVASRRPVTQGPLWQSVLAGGFMAGSLVVGAFFSIYEFATRDDGNGWVVFGTAVALGLITWCVWAVIFFRVSRASEHSDMVTRQCRTLIKGSVLELLIAVPTHIVARYRDYCCAGFLTFIGLTMGVSVMLFAYGPAVYFLYVERWKRLHPDANLPA